MDIIDITAGEVSALLMETGSLSHGDLIAVERVEGDYFFHQPAGVPGEALAVVCAGRERCLPGYRVDRSGFPFLGLEYVTSGSGRLRMGEERCALTAGSLFVYGPAIPHELEAVGEGLVKYFVDFSGTEAERILREQNLLPGAVRMLGSRRWARDIFDQLVACADLPRDKAAVLAPRLLELLLLRVGEDAQLASNQATGALETYARCRQYLRQNYTRISTVEEAARACDVSPAYCVRLFQRHSRESAYQFLVRLKMDHAGDLLVRRGLSVQAVAARVGYTDPYHFSRVFKRYHGLAPQRFRQRFQQSQPDLGQKNLPTP